MKTPCSRYALILLSPVSVEQEHLGVPEQGAGHDAGGNQEGKPETSSASGSAGKTNPALAESLQPVRHFPPTSKSICPSSITYSKVLQDKF